ncbi:MAG: hypothetical protein JWM82_4377 [Myxococcales bacterium]|jgi:hypothetical protein|nr:hypothetical protein [Myxococcales bacterium]
MNTTQTPKKRMTSTLLLLALLGSGLSAGGCAYGGIATTQDGSVIVARNSLFGGLRKIYVCKLNGTAMSCVETTNPP